MQMAFGLTNSSITDSDRTGTLANAYSDNTYDTVEFNYFPNVSPATQFSGPIGPSLSPTVFGGASPAAPCQVVTRLATSRQSLATKATWALTPRESPLPQNTTLEAQLTYDGTAQTLTLAMFQVLPGGALLPLDTGVGPLDLGAFGSGYDPTHPFSVDTLSIMAYHDGYTTADAPSLVGDMTFDQIGLVVPEPSSMLLAALAGFALIPIARRRVRERSALRTVAG